MKKKATTILNNHKERLVFLSIGVIIFLVHGPLLRLGFFSDDYHMLHIVAQNTQSIIDIFKTNLLGTNIGHSYGPVFKLLFIAEYKLFGLNPLGYHVVSLLLHFFATIAVYYVAKIFAPKSQIPAAAAILFSVMPVHVNAIAWISVQPHLLATVGFLCAIMWYLTYKNTNRVQWLVLSLVATGIALGAKDTAITILPIIGIIELFTYKKRQVQKGSTTKHQTFNAVLSDMKKRAIGVLPYIMITLGYLLLRSHATGSATAAYTGSLAVNFGNMERMFTEMTAAIFFPEWRMHLAVFMHTGAYVVLPIAIGFFGVLLYLIRKNKGMVLLLSLYVVSTVPFLFVAFNQINEEGNRYVYLSSTIAVILCSICLHLLTIHHKKRQHLFALLIMLIFFINIQATQLRFSYWQTADTLVKELIHSENIDQLDEQTPYTIIALPDNVQGAQVMRNAIFEAIELERGKKLTGERIPMYKYHDAFKPTQELTVSYKDSQIEIIRTYDHNGFTGFGAFESPTGLYTITNWDKWGSIGDSITITPSTLKQLLYVSHGQLRLEKVE